MPLTITSEPIVRADGSPSELNDVKATPGLTTRFSFAIVWRTHPHGFSMSEETNPPASDFPDPAGMQRWLEREIVDIKRAAELRIKDATEFVTAYSKGEISRDEAADRSFAYAERWGDAIPGVARSQDLSDEEILARIDAARSGNFTERFGEKPPSDPKAKRR
jgi:hypothetical protein